MASRNQGRYGDFQGRCSFYRFLWWKLRVQYTLALEIAQEHVCHWWGGCLGLVNRWPVDFLRCLEKLYCWDKRAYIDLNTPNPNHLFPLIADNEGWMIAGSAGAIVLKEIYGWSAKEIMPFRNRPKIGVGQCSKIIRLPRISCTGISAQDRFRAGKQLFKIRIKRDYLVPISRLGSVKATSGDNTFLPQDMAGLIKTSIMQFHHRFIIPRNTELGLAPQKLLIFKRPLIISWTESRLGFCLVDATKRTAAWMRVA